ncbi:hypothetical protein [Massilia sp. S19_KUP03_FR1]|uniref:hypothetical protein n=1 Tax=Massilia sp. S19_KUP03_FR1 TaxID=3025503 RepID=UPI002FCDB515
MRPSDENQHGSTRPNLLSGARRHVGGDDNILERLERDSARHASGNRSRAAWYAAAASLVLLLIIVLAWTAYDNASTVRVVPMTRVPDSGAAVSAPAMPAPASILGPALVQVPETPPPVPVAPQASAGAPLPPLVLLPRHEATAGKALTSAPPRTAGLASTAAPVPARPAVRASLVAAPAASAARPAPRPVAAVRQHKPGSGPLQADADADTDVALLSAIIIHDSAHAEEKAQLEAAAACTRAGAKKCPGRPGSRAALAN